MQKWAICQWSCLAKKTSLFNAIKNSELALSLFFIQTWMNAPLGFTNVWRHVEVVHVRTVLGRIHAPVK